MEPWNSFLHKTAPCSIKNPSSLHSVLGGYSCSARTAGWKAGQWAERKGVCGLLPANFYELRVPTAQTRVTCPQAHCLSYKIWAAEPQVTALTLAAELDVTQVIRDPWIPVHFGNRVRWEFKTEKKWKTREDRTADREVMQLQKYSVSAPGQAEREGEASQVVLERSRIEGGRGREKDVPAAVPA